ncbi:unnamed protein product [Ectocarpus sp. 12 AP-2014]
MVSGLVLPVARLEPPAIPRTSIGPSAAQMATTIAELENRSRRRHQTRPLPQLPLG